MFAVQFIGRDKARAQLYVKVASVQNSVWWAQSARWHARGSGGGALYRFPDFVRCSNGGSDVVADGLRLGGVGTLMGRRRRRCSQCRMQTEQSSSVRRYNSHGAAGCYQCVFGCGRFYTFARSLARSLTYLFLSGHSFRFCTNFFVFTAFVVLLR